MRTIGDEPEGLRLAATIARIRESKSFMALAMRGMCSLGVSVPQANRKLYGVRILAVDRLAEGFFLFSQFLQQLVVGWGKSARVA